MAEDEQFLPRPGSSADLSRRMDRMEQKHELLATEVAGLTSTVARVELNQQHAEELNKLRFGALDQGVAGIAAKLDAFVIRIEGIITGEVQTAQSRRGQELVEDYQRWREGVDGRLDDQDILATQVRLLGRLAVFLTGGSILGTGTALYVAFVK